MESEWREVVRKTKRMGDMNGNAKGGKLDVQRLHMWERVNMNNLSTYFFTEFPNDFGAKEMYDVFQNYGQVYEVVIPYRSGKNGCKYGFARFIDVREPEILGIKLDNIIIGSQKIHANIPRFERKELVEEVLQGMRKDVRGARFMDKGQQSNYRQNGRSFTDVTIRRMQGLNNRKNVQRYIKKDVNANMEFNFEEQTMKNFVQNAYVGRVCNPGIAYCIPEEFRRQGYFTIKATPLGLISFCWNLKMKES